MQNPALANNIVRLPTSAIRRVRQPSGMAMHHLARALPQHPAVWRDHGGRRPHEEATLTRSPELLVAAAVFKVLGDEQKARVRRYVETLADLDIGGPHAATALAIVEAIK